MFREIITHLLAAIIGAIGGWTFHCHYSSRQNKQKGDNNASNGGIIATSGSSVSNVGNNVVYNIKAEPNASPNIDLSEQAKRILVEFYKSNQTTLFYLVVSTIQGEIRQLSLRGISIEIEDDKTVDADMNDLVEGNYLRQTGTSDHSKHFEWTHKGRDYATQLLERTKH